MKRKLFLLAVAGLIAVIGASLVLFYVNGKTSQAATTHERLVKVLTATALIDTGESAAHAQSAGKFALSHVSKSDVVQGAVLSVGSMDSQVALAPIYPGEQILAARFGTTAEASQTLPVPKGMVAASVELSDPGRVAGFLTPGSHVAIFFSFTNAGDPEAPATFTRILVPDTEVIAVGPTTILNAPGSTSGAQAEDPVPSTILTIALDQRNVDRVLFASHTGGLAFGLIGPGTTITPDKGVTVQDLFK